ncbi:MAG: PKD domain-containing protein [Pseudomonadota bacterium]|nr:PKD domain-containing protein [Pseudomonadota bacterium]
MKTLQAITTCLPLFGLLALGACAGVGSHGNVVPSISGPSTVQAGVPESYTFSSTSPHDYPLSYGVNWGDGTHMPNALGVGSGDDHTSEHAWANPGSYTIIFTAVDGHGSSGTGSYVVQVVAPPAAE